jgi:hypothetical protein
MSLEQTSLNEKKPVPVIAWMASGVAIGGIWLMIVLAGIVAPDLVSGSQHERLSVASFNWIWGLVATALVVVAVQLGMRRAVATPTPWWALAVGVVGIWFGVVVVSAFGPVMVTGSDPTIVPYGAMGAPILGVFLTWFVCTLVKSSFEQDA